MSELEALPVLVQDARLVPPQPVPAPALGTEPKASANLGHELVDILSSVEETAYVWDAVSDRMDWETNACSVLGLASSSAIETGAAFELMIAVEHAGRRREAICGARDVLSHSSTSYKVQYRFAPKGRRARNHVWIEDYGRLWTGAHGKVTRARGVVRVITEQNVDLLRQGVPSDHDELTGQLNRTRLMAALSTVVERAKSGASEHAFLMVAVNNLASINEHFGYETGDEVITCVGAVIKERLRGGDTLGRYSSNKFGVILNDCGQNALAVAAERLIQAVAEASIKTSACQLAATISAGGVIIPASGSQAGEIVSHALQALDEAKAERRQTFVAFTPSPERTSTRRRNLALADEVMEALADQRMLLALQPIVHASTRKPALYEALLRMQRKDGTIVSAGEFIEVAEQLGLSRLLDRRALELAVALLKRQRDINLSINVSSLTTGDHDWLIALHGLTRGQRAITERLTVEITETSAITDIDRTMGFIDIVHDLGAKVALDDFGAGYTSFKNLKHLPADMLKIDGAFVRNLLNDESDQVFIDMMVALARRFKMEIVAEWVGDEATAQRLAQSGVDYLQGFHCGKPVLAADFEAARTTHSTVE